MCAQNYVNRFLIYIHVGTLHSPIFFSDSIIPHVEQNTDTYLLLHTHEVSNYLIWYFKKEICFNLRLNYFILLNVLFFYRECSRFHFFTHSWAAYILLFCMSSVSCVRAQHILIFSFNFFLLVPRSTYYYII